MDDDRGLGYVSCTAKSKQSQQRCKRRPIPGGTVCVMHGGGNPHTRARALERLIMLQSPAIDTLAYLMEQRGTYPSTAYAAARDVLDRTEGKAIDRVEQRSTGEIVIRVEKPW